MGDTVLLIPGAWQTPRAWRRFRARYEARGLRVLCPAWPGLGAAPERLRHAPPPHLARLGLDDLVAWYAAVAATLESPPILVGHGIGGLVVQRLLDARCGACGVAIATTPPQGVRIPLATLRALWPVVGKWASWRRPIDLGFADFTRDFAPSVPRQDSLAEYLDMIVPAPGRLIWQALLGRQARVNFDNPGRPPLLLIAGDADRLASVAMVRANAHRQQRAASRTDLQVFARRTHWLCNEPGWEEVADFAADWALVHARLGCQAHDGGASRRVSRL